MNVNPQIETHQLTIILWNIWLQFIPMIYEFFYVLKLSISTFIDKNLKF